MKYIPPQLTDSVDATISRKKVLNRAIKTEAQRRRRETMDDKTHQKNIHATIENRKTRQSKESASQRKYRLAHEASKKIEQRESAFEMECKEHGVQYTKSATRDESTVSKRTRRKRMRKLFKTPLLSSSTTVQQKKSKKTRVSSERNKCDRGGWGNICQCNRPPNKDSFSVVGKEGIMYASSETHKSKYISESDDLGKDRCYWERNIGSSRDKHLFSLELELSHACSVNHLNSDVVEIHINGVEVVYFWDCSNALASIDSGCLHVRHYYNPQHDANTWGWEEAFHLDVICSTLPEDVIQKAQQIIGRFDRSIGWDGHQLYDLLEEERVANVEFQCIEFEEFSMRFGKAPTYYVARQALSDRRMEKKYGHDWQTTWKKIEEENTKKKLEEDKKKYWRCPNGYEYCHGGWSECEHCREISLQKALKEMRKEYWRCVDGIQCCHFGWWGRKVRCQKCTPLYAKHPNKAKDLYSSCLNGYEICHEGVICCSGCKSK